MEFYAIISSLLGVLGFAGANTVILLKIKYEMGQFSSSQKVIERDLKTTKADIQRTNNRVTNIEQNTFAQMRGYRG